MFKILKSALTEKSCEGSSERLLQLCFGYFASYVVTGMLVKIFTDAKPGYPGMDQVTFLVYSTIGGGLVCLVVVLALGWYRLKSYQSTRALGFTMPAELLYIIPSGICTAVVIPTTTMMYLLPISVMVAMTIMRSSIIIVSRIIDAIQIHQGILHKKVYKEENIGVVFALIAASTQLFWIKPGDFDFVHNPVAMTILASYIVAYATRIYIMNYYKNTRPKGMPQDNKGFFAVEQLASSGTMLAVGLVMFFAVVPSSDASPMAVYQRAFSQPHSLWFWGIVAGMPYGVGAFFSVFLFMFKGRTATFAGLVNRLTSLVAGTVATLLLYFCCGGKLPKTADWISLVFIFIAVHYLALAERKRTAEMIAEKELACPPSGQK
ncbi:MAG: hypothetical protein GX410_08040 [Elusimicrobia bacterium]|nr:hypothetical protein [Elusimicrobiota bacterium]